MYFFFFFFFFFLALKILSYPENLPAMLNCAHGKDRTGLVSALVLACLGKTKEYIAADYARSQVGVWYSLAFKATTGDPTGISPTSLTMLFHCYKY